MRMARMFRLGHLVDTEKDAAVDALLISIFRRRATQDILTPTMNENREKTPKERSLVKRD